jgi:hypothetical protein
MPDPLHSAELIRRARELERLLARRRRALKAVNALEDSIRSARKLLADLVLEETSFRPLPLPGEDAPPADPERSRCDYTGRRSRPDEVPR